MITQQIYAKNNISSADIVKFSSSHNISHKWHSFVHRAASFSELNPPGLSAHDASKRLNISADMFSFITKFNKTIIHLNLNNNSYQLVQSNLEDFISPLISIEKNKYCGNSELSECVTKFKKEIPKYIEQFMGAPNFRKNIDDIISINYSDKWISIQKEKNEFNVYELPENISPQVDSIGNLYIPKNFLNRYTENERELILAHETAHVFLSWIIDRYLLLISNMLPIGSDSGVSSNDIKNFINQGRLHDETIVDLIAIQMFNMNEEQIVNYANLIGKLENSSLRGEMLQELAHIINHVSATNIFDRKMLAGDACNRGITINVNFPGKYVPQSTIHSLKRYADLDVRYQAETALDRITTVFPEKINELPPDFVSIISNHLLANGCGIVKVKSPGKMGMEIIMGTITPVQSPK